MVDILNTLGVGSGIDVKTLAKSLTDTVRVPQQTAIDTKKAAYDAKLSSVGKIMSVATSFGDALKSLGDPAVFQRKPTSSDTSKVSISFVDGKVPPTFSGQVAVQQIATNSSILFPPMSSLDSLLIGSTDTNRTLELFSGSAAAPGALISSVNLAEVKTLPALRDKINEIPGFMASIVQGGTASAPKYYIAVKNGTGASNNFYSTITKTVDGVKSNAAGTGLVLDGTEIIKQGVNAEITVDDVQIISETNSFVDILPGVELTANGTTAVGASVTITSKTDTEVLSSAMATLVSGFNVMMETIKQETKYDLDPKKRGGLANEAAGRQLMNELRSFTTQELAGYDDEIHTLSELGVRTNRNGSLTLDEATFAAVMQRKPDVVEAVLASKKMLTDSRLGVASVTDDVIPGVYTIAKTTSGAWTINDESATLTTGVLTADAGTSAEGLVISIPPLVANSVPSGYSTTLYYGKGLVERFNTMFSNLSDTQSSLQVLSKNSTKSIDTLAKDQSTLDSRMKQVEDRYLVQFARMNAILSEGKNTQESLTSFMEGWRASLKA